MDIRKLVNTRAPAQCAPMDVGHNECQWNHHHTLPPVSSILPDHAYNNNNNNAGHHYPIPPQGEGNVYTHYQQVYQQQPQQQQATYFAPQPQQQQVYQPAPPPSYQPQELPYLITNPSARGSSSTLSSTRYAPSSAGSGPATSAERRSLSDGEDDHEDDCDENVSAGSGGSTPLPPYYASNQHQQVCFADGAVTPPESRPGSEGTNEFVCDVCTVSYSRAPDLRRHKASVHNDRASGEKVSATFPCDVCGQVLLSSHGYQGHMRRHYDERPFVCEAPFCGKAFHDSATLARHRRTHSTEHKFECDFCGRRFKRKDNLNTHRKKHQVGGETINPNLLRKPVSRVAGGGGGGGSAGDSPIEGTPVSQGYPELPSPSVAAPPYQQIQVAPPPSQMQQQQQASPLLSVVPNYTSVSMPIQQQQQPPQQQQIRSAFPAQQQPQPPMYMQQQQAPMMQQQQQQHYPVQTQAPPYHTIPLHQPSPYHQQQQQQASPYLYQQLPHPHAGQYGVKAEEMSAMAAQAAAANANSMDGRARVYAVSAPRH